MPCLPILAAFGPSAFNPTKKTDVLAVNVKNIAFLSRACAGKGIERGPLAASSCLHGRNHTASEQEENEIMTTHIQAMLQHLLEAGFKATLWKNSRIYLNGYGRDISAYIRFDEPEAEKVPEQIFSGCALKVFTDAGAGKWAYNRRQDVMHQIATDLHRAGIVDFAPDPDPRRMIPTPDAD